MQKEAQVYLSAQRVGQGRFIARIKVDIDGKIWRREREFRKATGTYSLYKTLMSEVDGMKDIEITLHCDNLPFMAEITNLDRSKERLAGFLREKLAENNITLLTN